MDNLTREQRIRNMRAIKSRDSRAEILLRNALWKNGIRYRKNFNKLPGKPDIAITRSKIAIFCDGEFWHGYNWGKNKLKLKSNTGYWLLKIERNITRDNKVNCQLQNMGWKVIRFWNKEINKDLGNCLKEILLLLK